MIKTWSVKVHRLKLRLFIGLSVLTLCAVIYQVQQTNSWHYEISDKVVKILFFCYMRGGSTVGYQMFNVDPEVTAFYEPLAAYFMASYGMRPASKPHYVIFGKDWKPMQYTGKETWHLVRYIRHLFSCEFDELPPEGWLHPFMRSSRRLNPMKLCIMSVARRDPLRKRCTPRTAHCSNDQSVEVNKERLCDKVYAGVRTLPRADNLTQFDEALRDLFARDIGQGALPEDDYEKLSESLRCTYGLSRSTEHCMRLGMQLCQASRIRVGKLIRVRMADLAKVVRGQPEFVVVHYVRDPRAIALSRVKTSGLVVDPERKDIRLEAELLCRQMRQDIDDSRNFPDPSSFIRIRYEDFVRDPAGVVSDLYERLGISHRPVKEWRDFSQEAFFSKKDGAQFGTKRMNASASVDKWRAEIKRNDLRAIQKSCADVLKELDYPLVNA